MSYASWSLADELAAEVDPHWETVKDHGNEALNRNDFDRAVRLYTQGLAVCFRVGTPGRVFTDDSHVSSTAYPILASHAEPLPPEQVCFVDSEGTWSSVAWSAPEPPALGSRDVLQGPYTVGRVGVTPPPPLWTPHPPSFQCLRLTAKILLRRLWRQKDLNFKVLARLPPPPSEPPLPPPSPPF